MMTSPFPSLPSSLAPPLFWSLAPPLSYWSPLLILSWMSLVSAQPPCWRWVQSVWVLRFQSPPPQVCRSGSCACLRSSPAHLSAGSGTSPTRTHTQSGSERNKRCGCETVIQFWCVNKPEMVFSLFLWPHVMFLCIKKLNWNIFLEHQKCQKSSFWFQQEAETLLIQSDCFCSATHFSFNSC